MNLEKTNVIDIYDQIAKSFSSTRSSPWPLVKQYLDNLPQFSYIADIGCGNGVNQSNNKFLFESLALAKACQ